MEPLVNSGGGNESGWEDGCLGGFGEGECGELVFEDLEICGVGYGELKVMSLFCLSGLG